LVKPKVGAKRDDLWSPAQGYSAPLGMRSQELAALLGSWRSSVGADNVDLDDDSYNM